ncbi:MAG: lysophospholipase [Magnetovibrionaceae bacterium]
MALLASLAAACAPKPMLPGPALQVPELEEASGHFVMADGARLPLHHWPFHHWEPTEAGEPEAVLLAVHGFNDYGAFFDDAASWLSQNSRIMSYAFDQRGFGDAPNRGRWAGWQSMTDDLAAVVDLLKARHPGKPIYVLGVSMGAAVTLTADAHGKLAGVDGLILLAPAVWGRQTWPFYQRWLLGLTSRLVPGMTLTGRGLNIRPSDNIEMLIRIGQDPKVIKATRVDAIHGLSNLMDEALASGPKLRTPLALFYGLNDEIIPKGATAQFLSSLENRPETRITLFPTGWHMLTRDLGAIHVWKAIRSYIQKPPTPADWEPDALPQAIETLARGG